MKTLNYLIMTVFMLSAGVNIRAADNDSDKKTENRTEIKMLSPDGLNEAPFASGRTDSTIYESSIFRF
jgi:hypothetical protein